MDTNHRIVARKSIHVDGTTGEGHAVEIFRALANDTRVAILRYLGDRVVAVNQIAKDMGLPSSTATMHIDGAGASGPAPHGAAAGEPRAPEGLRADL